MTLRLVPTITLEKPKNVWEPLVRAEVIKRLSPILNIKGERIQKAFSKLSGQHEVKLLEALLIHAGQELLPFLPEIAEFPEPEIILETFFEDYKSDEDAFMFDDDFIDDEDDLHDVIHATEQLRLLKTVLYFWHLAKKEGREASKDTLVDTLHAMALYELLLTNGLTDLQVKFHSHTLTLPLDFRLILQRTKVKGPSDSLDGIRELITERISLEIEDADEMFVARAVKDAHRALEAVIARARGQNSTLRSFSHTLLEDEMSESLADIILDACPQPKKTK